jgi:hypothetical protein
MRSVPELDPLSWKALALHLPDPSAFAASCRRANDLVTEEEFRLEWFATHHRSVTWQNNNQQHSSCSVPAECAAAIPGLMHAAWCLQLPHHALADVGISLHSLSLSLRPLHLVLAVPWAI